MAHRDLLLAIAVIISLPVIVASFGASQTTGLIIGGVLILVGVLAWLAETRRDGEA